MVGEYITHTDAQVSGHVGMQCRVVSILITQNKHRNYQLTSSSTKFIVVWSSRYYTCGEKSYSADGHGGGWRSRRRNEIIFHRSRFRLSSSTARSPRTSMTMSIESNGEWHHCDCEYVYGSIWICNSRASCAVSVSCVTVSTHEPRPIRVHHLSQFTCSVSCLCRYVSTTDHVLPPCSYSIT